MIFLSLIMIFSCIIIFIQLRNLLYKLKNIKKPPSYLLISTSDYSLSNSHNPPHAIAANYPLFY